MCYSGHRPPSPLARHDSARLQRAPQRARKIGADVGDLKVELPRPPIESSAKPRSELASLLSPPPGLDSEGSGPLADPCSLGSSWCMPPESPRKRVEETEMRRPPSERGRLRERRMTPEALQYSTFVLAGARPTHLFISKHPSSPTVRYIRVGFLLCEYSKAILVLIASTPLGALSPCVWTRCPLEPRWHSGG